MDPLYNTTLIGGFDNEGKKYLASVDIYGTLIEADFSMGGMANYFCKVLLTKHAKPDMTEEQAREVITKCMKVLISGDTRASDQLQFCTITERGVTVEPPVTIKIEWDYRGFIEITNDKINSIKLS